jgi:hypothetical protein
MLVLWVQIQEKKIGTLSHVGKEVLFVLLQVVKHL